MIKLISDMIKSDMKITISDCTNKQSNHFYFYTNINFHMYDYARSETYLRLL